MATVFEETAINGMVMNNRMIRSATWEGMCEQDGRPTDLTPLNRSRLYARISRAT
jgi:2,4-dienoyl-CoA reductase-like NADH-dependent reductase (Old Yellow Enzyme family)